MKLWIRLTEKERKRQYRIHYNRLLSGSPTVTVLAKKFIAESPPFSAKAVIMSFDTYLQWYAEENVKDGVTLKFGRKLEIDGVPIKVDNKVVGDIQIQIQIRKGS